MTETIRGWVLEVLGTALGAAAPYLVGVGLIGAAVLIHPGSRRLALALVRRVILARRWERAMQRVGLADGLAMPRIRRQHQVPAGESLRVSLPPGRKPTDLATVAPALAVIFGASTVRVRPDPRNARWASVTVVRRDPLAARSIPWPHTGAGRLSLWDPIPVGVDEDGHQVRLSLPERNVLIGGEPGAGKSVSLSMLVATAALDPTAKLWLLDGKQVELASWGPCAERSVGESVVDAVDVLRVLQAEMTRRYKTLLGAGKRKVARDDGLPLHVVVVDELAWYLVYGADRKARGECAEVMRDLVSRGRAAGVIVLAATQKPAGDTVPTALRDLFGVRWALRCSTPDASDTILGRGWASEGYSATGIDSAARGVGYLLHEGDRPVRMRSYHVDDAALARLTAQAESLRGTTGETPRPASARPVVGR